jgi:type 1 glutamine amidotransferase
MQFQSEDDEFWKENKHLKRLCWGGNIPPARENPLINRTMKTTLLFMLALLGATFSAMGDDKLNVLLIDGQNNHAWAETSPVLVSTLEGSGRFDVDVSTTPGGPPKPPRKPKGNDEKQQAAFNDAMKKWMEDSEQLKKEGAAAWDSWRPVFADYDVVVSNYNGELWPEEVRTAFEEYVSGGGGFVAVHAADNSHPAWAEYNKMIALGGWGGRNEMSGPYLRLRDGKFVEDKTPGRGGAHGQKHEFKVVTREAEHPIVKGLPAEWMHATDELYGMLRGPAENVTVLASAFSDEGTGGSGEDEPILMVISYGDGRVFHTTLGHDTTSMSGVGFQESLARGVEWAATGDVTFKDVRAEDLPAEGSAATR